MNRLRNLDFSMERLARIALGLIVVLNLIATVVAFGESYSGLFQWAITHGVAGFWGGVWPLMIDLIILVGEAALFIGHHFRWRKRDKAWAWIVTFAALGVSISANTGHVLSLDWLSHLTAALPPIALMFTMTVGLGVMKRYYLNRKPSQPVQPTPAAEAVIGMAPVRTTGERAHVGTTPWVSAPGLETVLTPVGKHESPAAERPAPKIPESLDPTETFAGTDLKVIPGKSYSLPRDERQGLELPQKRVRDMVDVDPDISVNAIAQALGVAWATAKKYYDGTMEARGIKK